MRGDFQMQQDKNLSEKLNCKGYPVAMVRLIRYPFLEAVCMVSPSILRLTRSCVSVGEIEQRDVSILEYQARM
jgi:hypothetical protein